MRRRWYAAAVLAGALYGCAHPPPDVAPGDTGALAPVEDVAASSTTTPVPAPGEGAWASLPSRTEIAAAITAATTTIPPTTVPPTTVPPTTVPPAPPTTAAPPPPPLPVPPAPAAPAGSVWDRLAACESGGNWHINTGNGHYGGLQFTLQSWRGVGGAGYPHEHSRAEQIARAERLLALQGWGAWPGCARQLGLR